MPSVIITITSPFSTLFSYILVSTFSNIPTGKVFDFKISTPFLFNINVDTAPIFINSALPVYLSTVHISSVEKLSFLPEIREFISSKASSLKNPACVKSSYISTAAALSIPALLPLPIPSASANKYLPFSKSVNIKLSPHIFSLFLGLEQQ